MKILGIGAGGSTKVILEVLHEADPETDVVGILDDDESKHGERFEGISILGGIDRLAELRGEVDAVIIGVGARRDVVARTQLFEKIQAMDMPVLGVRSCHSTIAASVTLGQGVIIMPGVTINSCACLGHNVFVNTGSIIEHDCQLQPNVFLGPGCVLSGYVEVGVGTFIGSGSVVIGNIRIGRDVTLGAGSVVTRDIPDGVIAYGCPAHRNMRRKNA